MYEIRYSPSVSEDLNELKAFLRRQILDMVDEQLSHVPTRETRRRKLLHGLIPPFDADPPVWELRVGEYRVFYDVDEVERVVYVRAVRHKPPHKTTEDVL
ncbi:MAG: type II toxin-antitoxin system RelE/ParE family toxin [Kiritimatiellae bacterium]|nr:type II toxin-antitoxin system RelE/ParE family toxin [Kiritimatiellia bacterium]